MVASAFLPAMVFALVCFATSAGYCESDAPDPGAPREFSDATLAEVDPGHTTKTDVERLLGQPWRTVVSDPDESDPEIWEYRGRDASGTYIVHIEFDNHDVTTLIAKVPDKTGEAPARVAKTPPGVANPQKR